MSREDSAFIEFPEFMPLHYNRAIRVGDLVFVAGQIPAKDGQIVHQGDVEMQTRQVYENLRTVLAQAGATLDDVVQETIYLSDKSLLPQVAKTRLDYYSKSYPTNTTVFGSEGEGYVVEVSAIAHTGG